MERIKAAPSKPVTSYSWKLKQETSPGKGKVDKKDSESTRAGVGRKSYPTTL